MINYSIVFATNNKHKIEEVVALLPDFFTIRSLDSIGFNDDIPENEPTIVGNATFKAQYIYDKFNIDVFAEDTGLEVDALGGEPGVYSARYAGPQRDSMANIKLLLRNLEGIERRTARFRTCMTLILDGQTYQFEGIAEGRIASEMSGNTGFGYDPVFIPEGYSTTFAEMTMEEKGKISHRSKALNQLIDFLLSK